MNQTTLIALNDIENINPKITNCTYTKSDNSKISLLQCWELDEIEKQDKLLKVFDCSDDDDEHITFEQNIELSGGPQMWQNVKWEADIIYNERKFNAVNIMELSWEQSRHCLPPVVQPEMKRRRIRSKKTVFDLYPVNLDQNGQFLAMERNYFPLLIDEDCDISASLKLWTTKHVNVFNGESQSIINLEMNTYSTMRAEQGNVILYESSEQHAPFRMQAALTSLLVAYGTDDRIHQSSIGVPRTVARKSPFLGTLSTNVHYQLALENAFFRVPIFEHKVKKTDFLLIYSDKGISIRKLDSLFLGGKQMPLTLIPNPKSSWFKSVLLKIIVQKFIDDDIISADILAPFLSHFEFLNLKSDLQKIAILNNERKFWKLKVPLPPGRGIDGINVQDYVMYMAIVSYLVSYGYVEADLKRKKAIKRDRKKEYKNATSPWAISKAYINGVFKGFWKLSHFETPIPKNQMNSYLFTTTLVQKRSVDKSDLRKLTGFQLKKLLLQFSNRDKKKKDGSSRWNMVQELASTAAVEGGDAMLKYARESKSNKRLLRKKYTQQCEETFEKYRQALSNVNDVASDTELSADNIKTEKNDITIEEFRRSLKESEIKSTKLTSLPLKRCSETARKLIGNSSKYVIIYRIKDGVVEQTKLAVDEIVLEYLKQTKQGSKTLKTIYGISEKNKSLKQRERDKKRRQDAYMKKRMELNLPIDSSMQDTTDKICSSCGRKGHIRTNQECPNYGKTKDYSTPPKAALFKRSDSLTYSPMRDKILTISPRNSNTSNIKRQYQSPLVTASKRPNDNANNSNIIKKPRLLKSKSMEKKQPDMKRDCQDSTEDEDDEFIINIPPNFLNQYNSQICKEEPRKLTPIQEVRKTENLIQKPKRRKTIPKKETQFSGCMAPFGSGPVEYQTEEYHDDRAVKKESTVGNVSSDDDNEFTMNIDMKLLRHYQQVVKKEEKSPNMGGSSADDSDDMTFTFSADQWNTTNRYSGNKENIATHHMIQDDIDTDDEFTIRF